MKHTPGPWIVDGNGLSRSWNVSADVSICDVTTSREDACLIAAAPEMLELLNKMHAAYAMDDDDMEAIGKIIRKVES